MATLDLSGLCLDFPGAQTQDLQTNTSNENSTFISSPDTNVQNIVQIPDLLYTLKGQDVAQHGEKSDKGKHFCKVETASGGQQHWTGKHFHSALASTSWDSMTPAYPDITSAPSHDDILISSIQSTLNEGQQSSARGPISGIAYDTARTHLFPFRSEEDFDKEFGTSIPLRNLRRRIQYGTGIKTNYFKLNEKISIRYDQPVMVGRASRQRQKMPPPPLQWIDMNLRLTPLVGPQDFHHDEAQSENSRSNDCLVLGAPIDQPAKTDYPQQGCISRASAVLSPTITDFDGLNVQYNRGEQSIYQTEARSVCASHQYTNVAAIACLKIISML